MSNGIQLAVALSDKVSKKKKIHKKFLKYSLSETSKNIFVSEPKNFLKRLVVLLPRILLKGQKEFYNYVYYLHTIYNFTTITSYLLCICIIVDSDGTVVKCEV
jgi:hypothetical protein